MLIRQLADCSEFTAGDGTILREILKPDGGHVQVRYSMAHAKLAVGQKSRRHRLASTEVYFILQGTGVMEIDGERRHVEAGDCIYIPPSAVQNIENSGNVDLIFLCVVDPAWTEGDEEVI